MSGKTVLLNTPKLLEVIDSPFADQVDHKVGLLLNNAKQRLKQLKNTKGCNCKKGPQRSIVYEDVKTQLKNMDPSELDVLKQYLGARKLNLGKGCQV